MEKASEEIRKDCKKSFARADQKAFLKELGEFSRAVLEKYNKQNRWDQYMLLEIEVDGDIRW